MQSYAFLFNRPVDFLAPVVAASFCFFLYKAKDTADDGK
jgi:hypothetical protein